MFVTFMRLGVSDLVVPVFALSQEEMGVTQAGMRGAGWFNATEADYMARVGTTSPFSSMSVVGTMGA